MVVCNRNKPEHKKGKVFFINARDQIAQEGKDTFLSKEHIKNISEWYKSYKDISGRCKIVTNDEILLNKDCSLSVSLYATLYKDRGKYGKFSELIPEWEACSESIQNEVNNLISLLS